MPVEKPNARPGGDEEDLGTAAASIVALHGRTVVARRGVEVVLGVKSSHAYLQLPSLSGAATILVASPAVP
jgi:hypothetical protein